MQTLLMGIFSGAIVSGVVVYFLLVFFTKKQEGQDQENLNKLLQSGQEEVRTLISEAKAQAAEERKRIEEEKVEIREKTRKTEEIEAKIVQKEERIEQKLEEIDKKQISLREKEDELEKTRSSMEETKKELQGKLSEISQLSVEEAKEMLLKRTEEIYEKDILAVIEKKKTELRVREKELSREILIKSIQQYSGDVTAEMTQTLIHLENDDIKGKLIGKEGRNIIAFERATGVSLIIDDSPDTVFISSFDLFRRYIAKKSLEQLIEDKRIQPARIEEIVEQNQQDADKVIYDLGEKALNEMGITGIPDEIIPLIGKLRFRTSYGQNILIHSKEVAYIAEAIAKQIGADSQLALKGGLLHDIGKALDHDIEGTHPEIGGKIARKYGLSENLINIIEGHHDAVPQICIETKIIQIADAISAVRPGARRMNAEEYIKRIQEMENVAMSFSGVSKAYALSAGREVRVFVDAATVSDYEAEQLAQQIAGSIEANLSYPGEVKVNLIREKRVIEYAR
ncbi:ribonuclease Y [Candidatus Gracilibacteria bacterium]|nr:ribonuclease Y [Candidatus Gracilibacteria bacterium]OIO77358.1 MAG: ribonuclease Y [Candidatus Gracilibacteria bacterium CG1_02_38_174]PIQ12069.1 MAG: ribonuclease Y [Candidatus Gracilibacteria bacterium CG18_big_fil_WC_8_21_14_2_50_38_16]PIQ42252.1 MAG: ribonuclease Y [Candidatus Gracilibacteria bacterium CG12_big_fil_rev_8_21_14_0_65_38_15]PIZ01361.1 MAG: ribonuclease Y [Candidatus Gracilibacteria bacterium CG_4_10_14_0_8_um_filter_38_28]